tara:strand:- start:165 stop:341 length:177 start_codon:yes stop_codon:yes gene_type:complete
MKQGEQKEMTKLQKAQEFLKVCKKNDMNNGTILCFLDIQKDQSNPQIKLVKELMKEGA